MKRIYANEEYYQLTKKDHPQYYESLDSQINHLESIKDTVEKETFDFFWRNLLSNFAVLVLHENRVILPLKIKDREVYHILTFDLKREKDVSYSVKIDDENGTIFDYYIEVED